MRAVVLTIIGWLAAAAALAQSLPVTLTVSPATGVSPVIPTISWSSPGAATCTATGGSSGWAGTRVTSGTITLPAITASATYNLTCYGSGGWADLSWTAPTTRTDGSPLTNLSLYGVWVGSSATTLVRNTNIPANTAQPYRVNNLPAGLTYFAMTAIDANQLESAKSTVANKTIVVASGSATATVTVTSAPPNPPSGLVVVVTTAYNIVKQTNRFAFKPVGTVPLGTACSTTYSVTGAIGELTGGLNVVPREKVTWSGLTKPLVVVAACG